MARVVQRGEVRYAELGPPFGRRPVLILTANRLIPVLSAVTCAPVTSSGRGIPTRVSVGHEEGLRDGSEVVCDALATIAKADIETAPLGSMAGYRMREVDRAIALALDMHRANLPPG